MDSKWSFSSWCFRWWLQRARLCVPGCARNRYSLWKRALARNITSLLHTYIYQRQGRWFFLLYSQQLQCSKSLLKNASSPSRRIWSAGCLPACRPACLPVCLSYTVVFPLFIDWRWLLIELILKVRRESQSSVGREMSSQNERLRLKVGL